MDRYRISFKCNKIPDQLDGLKGFKVTDYYEGRAYNGLFEVSPNWGYGQESKLISKALFEKYFELISEENLIKNSA
ncbi:hypothetical protein JKA74_11895 [Marivirga sp. S37H4]|uniref:Uncharacterized protein n=1 Tax=Marivirga aurantiaca TaxID=2802615 RepID=A0A934WZQ1_9BACT|nr:hypothetical protein [Marivirga aurantiaca]MBK6265741.1 hypothetical protein [Marivirga aurantiaca]